MFKKLLIANRGEIACRVMRTAQRMGIGTVAVYSDADRRALHVTHADETVYIGPAEASASYLNIDRILQACQESGAEAVHPGYGFLSENADFARAVEEAGLCFIGPHWRAIAAMGDKLRARRIAAEEGVSVIPGVDAPVASLQELASAASEIGYPVMLKAAAGGGGKGLRVVRDAGQLHEEYEACRREAAAAFSDDRVFVEKFIAAPRHVEVQVLADTHGHCVSLFERECSIQRRHQKLIEESPSPFVDASMRAEMCAQAKMLARAVDYCSVGTVEFVVDADRHFYFLEMNTRLQVEHPVTEAVTGLDLVEQMIRVAAGQALNFSQKDVMLKGWAMECRLNAENPRRDFLPASGRVSLLRWPTDSPGVRVDAGVYEGAEVPLHYDSLVAKVIATGDSRNQALVRMQDVLDALVLRGIRTNQTFLAAVLAQPRFRAGDFDTRFIEQAFPDGFENADLPEGEGGRLAALAAVLHLRRLRMAACLADVPPRRRYQPPRHWEVVAGHGVWPVQVHELDEGWLAECERGRYRIRLPSAPEPMLVRADVDGQPWCVQCVHLDDRVTLVRRGHVFAAHVLPSRIARLRALMPETLNDEIVRLRAPMPGVVRELVVGEGDRVRVGQKVAVIEAMKMENVVRAEKEGVVREILIQAGETVAADDELLRLE